MNIKNETGINVLSLFDGISVAQLALKELGVKISNYYASEIDANPIKVTQHHFPNTIQLGDVRNINTDNLSEIDLLVCGSPCVDLSSLRKNRKGLEGNKSSLFYEALKILNKVKPKYFLFENVGSMSKEDMHIISGLLGVTPININSNLVSGQNRNRLYWSNIPNIVPPEDKKILLGEVITDGYLDKLKSNCVLTKQVPFTKNGLKRYIQRSIGQIVYKDKKFAQLKKIDKLIALENMTDEDAKKLFRPFTVNELEVLQTLPKGYVGDVIKKTPAVKTIGNAFNLDTIKYILSFTDFC